MRPFLSVVGPITLTFVFWGVITMIPMPAFILLPLVVFSGVLMLWGIVYFQETRNKQQ